MRTLTLIWVLVGIICPAFSQTITIKNQETGEPVEMVTLSSKNRSTFTVTNALGQADISAFGGLEKIEIRRLGYLTQVLSFSQIKALNFSLLMKPSETKFDEVVVSGTRWSQPSINNPSKISVISPKEVALNNPQTAADLLAVSGEVFIQKSQQGGGSPMIRGFATNRLLYSVDGVRMNTAIFRAGNVQNVISLDPFSIENTEVFFGPGSVIYGSDAIGGVMSFRTITPQLSEEEKPLITGNALSRYASANNEITNHLNLNVGWKKWASVTSFSHNKFGDLRMGKSGPDDYLKPFYIVRMDSMDRIVENPDPLVQIPTAYNQMNLMQKIRFKPNEFWDFQAAWHYSETGDYSRYDRLIELRPDGLPRSAVWNYGPQIWMMSNFLITHSRSNLIYDNLQFRLAHQFFKESRIDRNFAGNQRFRLRTQVEEVQAYSANLDFEKITGKHTFYYGAEIVLNDVNSNANAKDIRDGSPIATPSRYPSSIWSSNAVYLSYQFKLSEKLLFQAGARFGMFSIDSDFASHLEFFPFDFTQTNLKNSATNGSLGMVYRPGETWKIGINGSSGFRAPNVDDIGKIFDFAGGEVVVPNPSLKPEYVYNGELSISKIFGERVKLDLAGFYTWLNNAMVRREFQVNGQDSILFNGEMSRVYAVQNAAFGTVYGFNAGIEIALPAGFRITSRYNYQLGTEEMENGETSRSRHAAPAFGITRLSYRKDQLDLQISAVYNAAIRAENLNEEEKQKPFLYAKDQNGNPWSPGWYSLNFSAMYQFHTNFSVSGGVENLTNQRYRPYSSGLVAPGRNFIISLRANF